MYEPSQLDIAQLKFEMRQMYKRVGFECSLQVLYEMLVGARVMTEVIMEEKAEHEII
jgi:hypothetical protein